MTRIMLTDLDYQVIEAGDLNAIKEHFNEVRNEQYDTEQELAELQNSVRHAIQATESGPERACALKQALEGEKA